MIGEVTAEHGGIDILVNNAGLHSAGHNRPSAEIGIAGLRRLFDVNVMGVYVCSLPPGSCRVKARSRTSSTRCFSCSRQRRRS